MKRLEAKYTALHLVPLIERLGTPQVRPVHSFFVFTAESAFIKHVTSGRYWPNDLLNITALVFLLHFSFSKLPLLVRATSWPKRGCAAVCRCSRSSSRECEPSWTTPFGADRCLATVWCMWTSVWSSTVSGAPCSLCTAYPWEPMSSQWSECSSTHTRLHHVI